MTTATTALTTQQPTRGLALSTFDDALRFSQMVAKSEFAPKDFRGKPESCLLAIQHGAEVGLSPMQALQSIAVINGRPSIWGDAALAVVVASQACDYVFETIEGDGEQMVAVCEAKRKQFGKPVVVRFSVADAKKAGLWGKTGPWTQYPKRMLQLRARGFALRDAFPDVLKGMVTAEEAQDYAGDSPVPVSRPPALPSPPIKADPPPTKTATEGDCERARAVINSAKTAEQLERFRAEVERRTDGGFYTSQQASDLIDCCDLRAEIINERDAVANEVAS